MYINNKFNYLSIRLKLDDIIVDRNFEIQVLENIRYCRKVVGQKFRVVFWNENLSDKDCQKFVDRNKHLLFEVNTKITKEFTYTWFLIRGEGDKSNCRYTIGSDDILKGISEYLRLSKFLIRKEE